MPSPFPGHDSTPGPARLSPSARIDALLAEHAGSIPWERFMEAALYDPGAGYYTRHVRDIGLSADFSTSATLGTALAAALAKWSRAQRHPWRVIELGGGNGALARDFRRTSRWRSLFGLNYHIVEIGRRLQSTQRTALRRKLGRHVHWHGSIGRALAACRGRAAVFGNEFIDAFPCVALRNDPAEGWRELRVEPTKGGLHLVWGALTNRGQQALAATTLADLPPHTCIEVHLSFCDWLAQFPVRQFQGRLLFIDYGGATPAWFAQRPRGTLRGYFAQQIVRGGELLHRFGRQDLTADVCFADIRKWAVKLGWEVEPLRTQAEFIAQWAGHRASRLADGRDAGGAFQVVELHPAG